jgi:hypothetical protein
MMQSFIVLTAQDTLLQVGAGQFSKAAETSNSNRPAPERGWAARSTSPTRTSAVWFRFQGGWIVYSMITGQGSRQRQSTLTLGAGEPSGLHVNTVICTSL